VVDSRGVPTVEVQIKLATMESAIASVPSGASTGSYEAFELRDNDNKKFFSKGVQNAVNNVNTEIRETILGFDSTNQKEIDNTLIELDGTKNKSRLGANAILATSLACARVSAKYQKLPLYKYIGGIQNYLPTPMMNIVNGGCHANNRLDFQEFMIIPLGFKSFKDSLRCGCEVFYELKRILSSKSFSTSVGDEGGFAPDIKSNNECLDLILKAINKAGYKEGKDVYIGLDVASSEFYENKRYKLEGENLELTSESLIKYYENLINNYPIISIEDALDEGDWEGWTNLTNAIGNKCQLVGDDLFVTSDKRLQFGIDKKAGNSILIKLNQIGTLSETMDTINLAKKNHYNTIISHRSGETEDTFIADLSVGVSAGQIKAGSLSRSERICKYNQLLRIEDSDEYISFSGNIPFSKYINA
jgi:enolase